LTDVNRGVILICTVQCDIAHVYSLSEKVKRFVKRFALFDFVIEFLHITIEARDKCNDGVKNFPNFDVIPQNLSYFKTDECFVYYFFILI